MGSSDLYKHAIENAMARVMGLAIPTELNGVERNAEAALRSRLFDFEWEGYNRSTFIIKKSIDYSYQMVRTIIFSLLDSKGIRFKPIQPGKGAPAQISNERAFMLVIENEGERILYFFREFGLSHRLPNSDMAKIQEMCGASTYEHVCFVLESVHSEIIGSDDNGNTPDGSTHNATLRDFFVRYFGEDEYETFQSAMDSFSQQVKDYLGYSAVTELSPAAMYSFKKHIRRELRTHQYEEIQTSLSEEQVNWLKSQFMGEEYYEALTGSEDFAVSFITAEWLYGSLKGMRGIDLTPVAMGYLKAIEQFLFEVIRHHVGDHSLTIYCGEYELIEQADGRKRKKSVYTRLDRAFNEREKDINLGSLTGFFNYMPNFKLYRQGAPGRPDEIAMLIGEQLKKVRPLRNGYFHRDNIKATSAELAPWEKVDAIREQAYSVFFLMLGSLSLDRDECDVFGIPEQGIGREFGKLWEHVYYNGHTPFYVEGAEGPLFSHVDPRMSFDEYGTPQYSGIYFQKPGSRECALRIGVENPPGLVQEGKIIFGARPEDTRFSGPLRTVFEDGRCCADEGGTA